MAASISSFLNRIASLGLGVAVVGGVVNTALYNGEYFTAFGLFEMWNFDFWNSTNIMLAGESQPDITHSG